MKIKDGIVYSEQQVRERHRNVSFSASTYYELGYEDYVLPEETIDIETARSRKRSEIDSARMAANSSFFLYGGAKIACDPISMSDIDKTAQHIALTGSFHPEFPGVWKGKDPITGEPKYVPMLTVSDFIAMHAAMVAQGTANFTKSEQLKNEIKLAGTVDAVMGIHW